MYSSLSLQTPFSMQSNIRRNRECYLEAEIRELKRKLADSDTNLKNANQQNENLLSVLEYLKTYLPKETQLKDLALNEISRKEDVIIHKDMKATRLIKIIREKNDIINNLKRRRAFEQMPAGLSNKNTPGSNKIQLSADSDKNWRSRKN